MNAWTPPSRRGPPWVRLGLAGALVVVCALAGLGMRCDGMPGSDFLALLLTLAVQVPIAFGSFVASARACLRRDWRRARIEAGIALLMLLTIALAFWAMVSLAPDCPCQDDGC